jgi:hypothetical protein
VEVEAAQQTQRAETAVDLVVVLLITLVVQLLDLELLGKATEVALDWAVDLLEQVVVVEQVLLAEMALPHRVELVEQVEQEPQAASRDRLLHMLAEEVAQALVLLGQAGPVVAGPAHCTTAHRQCLER